MQSTRADVGYQFHPWTATGQRRYCYARLDVNLFSHPTDEHFDPEQLKLQVVGSDGVVRPFTFHHPWNLQPGYRFSVGRILLRDRANKTVDAFSFGGRIDLTVHAGYTSCMLASSVPIFNLASSYSIPTMLASEVEIILAQTGAVASIRNPIAYAKRLGEIEPLTLYASCLSYLETRFAAFPSLGSGMYRDFLRFVRNEMAGLKAEGRWPATVTAVKTLLSV